MVRVGVVGVGAWGQKHARVYAAMEHVELIGVCDADPAAGQAVAQKYKTQYYKRPQDLFGGVDAVSIVVPTAGHSEVGCAFLEQGIDTLVEKPLASTLADADRLIACAARHRRLLQVGHLERFNPAVVALRTILTDPRFFEIHRLGVFSPRSLDIDVVLDVMIHDLDILLALVPSPIVTIRALGIPILTPKIDIANARIEFQNGCVANVTASRVSSERVRKIRFFQPNSYVSLDYERQTVSLYSLIPAPSPVGKEIVARSLVIEPYEPLRAELESFVACVESRAQPVCSGEDGRRALELACQVLNHMHTDRAPGDRTMPPSID
ncbi:MAG: Gfo/Idh/MocA family oxidoreductase [Acidobacteria bacterium]|nr:Gfo/Idh/MocA family oxidoreductase [Acidobacteriota bacterium]MBI3655748.1 Gfo/Idh/MocA family oxidoreductase [Acidobacteriota bacterium]